MKRPSNTHRMYQGGRRQLRRIAYKLNHFRRDIEGQKMTHFAKAACLLTAAVICMAGAFYLINDATSVSAEMSPIEIEYLSSGVQNQMFEFSQLDENLLMYAAKSSSKKKVSPRKKSAVSKKRNSRPQKRSNSFVRKRTRSSSSLEASRKRVAGDFVEYMCIGAVGFALLGFFWRYQKEFGDNQNDLKDLTNAPPIRADGYQAKPIILSGPQGPDPMTFERTDVFQRVAGQGKKPSIALDLSVDGTELANGISNEIDEIISTIKVLPQGGISPAAAPMLLLPAEMLGHFEGLPQETLVWSAPIYIKGVCEGMMAITSHRILALYEKRSLKLWLPSVVFQTRRNQVQLNQVSLYKPIQVNRPSFLALGTCIFWWFPFGTVGACVAIGAFLFLTRRELGVWTTGQKKTYPLSMVDLEEAMSSIRHVTGMQPLGRHESVHPGHKAG